MDRSDRAIDSCRGDRLERQIVDIDHKIEELNGTVEQLSQQISQLMPSHPSFPQPREQYTPARELNHAKFPIPTALCGIEHKDILLDNNHSYNENNASEPSLSSDIQIRRLTAQLTAAYNRIAALEEQLLACRIHP